MTVGIGAGVATETAIRDVDDEGVELVLHTGCQNWTVTQYKEDYPTFLNAWRFGAMFSDGSNMGTFDQRDCRSDTDTVE